MMERTSEIVRRSKYILTHRLIGIQVTHSITFMSQIIVFR